MNHILGFFERLSIFFWIEFLIFSCVRILFSILSFVSMFLCSFFNDWMDSLECWWGRFNLLSFLISEREIGLVLLCFLILYIVELIDSNCLWSNVLFLLNRFCFFVLIFFFSILGITWRSIRFWNKFYRFCGFW